MCMGFAREIKAWVCMTEQNERDAMLQAWAETFAAADDTPPLTPAAAAGKPEPSPATEHQLPAAA